MPSSSPPKNSSNGKRAPTAEAKIQRLLLVTLCALFLTAGLLIEWFPLLNDGSSEFVSGTLLKVGFVLGIAWLAAPQLERFGWQRIRGSLLLGLIIVIVLWAIRPRIGAIAGAVLIGGSLLFGLVGWLRQLTKPPRA